MPSSASSSESIDEPGCNLWSAEIEDLQEEAGSGTSIEPQPSVEFDLETAFFDEPACSYWIKMEVRCCANLLISVNLCQTLY